MDPLPVLGTLFTSLSLVFLGGILGFILGKSWERYKSVQDWNRLITDLYRFINGKVYGQIQLRRSRGIVAAAADVGDLHSIIRAAATHLPRQEQIKLQKHINHVLTGYGLPKFFLDWREEDKWIDWTEGGEKPWPLAVKEERR